MAKRPVGRPRLEIDPEQVHKLAQLGCKTSEIANFLSCSTDTIENNFSAELIKGRAEVKMSLRRWQLEAARKLNPTMLIWLGKQMLKQSDSHELVLKEADKTYAALSDEELIKKIEDSSNGD